MSPLTAARATADAANNTRGDQLRSQMYANREFMLNVRRGYEEGLRGEGIPVDEYFRKRGLI